MCVTGMYAYMQIPHTDRGTGKLDYNQAHATHLVCTTHVHIYVSCEVPETVYENVFKSQLLYRILSFFSFEVFWIKGPPSCNAIFCAETVLAADTFTLLPPQALT